MTSSLLELLIPAKNVGRSECLISVTKRGRNSSVTESLLCLGYGLCKTSFKIKGRNNAIHAIKIKQCIKYNATQYNVYNTMHIIIIVEFKTRIYRIKIVIAARCNLAIFILKFSSYSIGIDRYGSSRYRYNIYVPD